MQGSARLGAGLVACLLAVAALLWPGVGWGASRVALVVGNSGYAGTPLPKLRNAVNDAELMARTLQTVGFKVTLVTDADQAKMKEAIKAFGKQLVRAGQDAVGLFFYAGHGAEATGRSYLIPIGADLEAVMDYQTDAVPAEWVLSRMGAAGNRVNVVILDACRNNLLPAAYRSGGVGIAPIPAPSGTLIAYSAAPNQQALDGDGDHSPYAEQLARFIVEPGLKVEDVFKRVGAAVEKNTGGEQSPWKENSLRTDFYFVAKAEEPPSPKPVPKTVVKTGPPEQTRQQLAARAYEAAERVNTPPGYRLIVEQYPGTLYAKLAGEQIRKLEQARPPPTSVPKSVETSLGLTRDQRVLVQRGLAALGFDVGSADGKFGARTRAGIERWQSSRAGEVTGYLDAGTAETLIEAGRAARSEPHTKVVRAEPPRRVVAEAMGLVQEALRIARSVHEPMERSWAFSSISEAQAKVGDVHGAVRSLSEALAVARGIERTFSRDAALREVVKAQARADDVPGALATAREIRDKGGRALAVRMVADSQAKAGDVRGALVTARTIDTPPQRGWAYSTIAVVQAAGGDIQGALATVRSVRMPQQHSRTLVDIARVQANAGDDHGAMRSISQGLAIALNIKKAGLRAWALSHIAAAQAKVGDANGAAGSISEATAIARSIKDDTERDHALRDVAKAKATVGDVRGALAIIRAIKWKFNRYTALSDIAEVQARAGDSSAAKATARSIGSKDDRSYALYRIARAQARAGDVATALTTARSIQDAERRVRALSDIAGALVETRNRS